MREQPPKDFLRFPSPIHLEALVSSAPVSTAGSHLLRNVALLSMKRAFFMSARLFVAYRVIKALAKHPSDLLALAAVYTVRSLAF